MVEYLTVVEPNNVSASPMASMAGDDLEHEAFSPLPPSEERKSGQICGPQATLFYQTNEDCEAAGRLS